MSSPLAWEWKREPVSPPQIYEDTWILDDSSAVEDLTALKLHSTIVKDELLSSSDTKNKAEVVSRLLEDLNNLDQFDFMKEEPFSNWLEEKVELPIFEDISVEPVKSYNVPQIRLKHEELKPIPQFIILQQQQQHEQQQQQHPVQDTNALLQEFETVFGAVELTHGQLTPPQSPPLGDRQILTTLSPVNAMPVAFVQPIVPATPVVYYQTIPDRGTIPMELQPGTPQPDVAHELAVVDELVRSRAEDMVDSWDGSSATSKFTSPSSPSSSSSSCSSEYSSDPEWIPEPVQTSPSSLVDKPSKSSRKRAGKPYSRIDPQDKKSRKKEQNKNAATRYRMKKKAEIEEILTEEKALADSNDELQGKVTDLQREIKYLKGLMRDLFKAKGLMQ